MDAIDVQDVLRKSYALQQADLDINNLILASLYQHKIISKLTRDKIRDEKCKQNKALALLDHLERVDGRALLRYCEVLEESSERDNDDCHRRIATKLRSDILSSAGICVGEEEAISDVLKLAACDSAPPPRHMSPGRIDRRGALQTSNFAFCYQELWQLKTKDSKRARKVVQSIQDTMADFPDVQVGLMQAASGFNDTFIAPLQMALELSDSCKNSNILRCRINWHLMWCYDRQGAKDKRDHCLECALTEANNIGPDFSVSFISAWKAYQIMIGSNRDSEILKIEKPVSVLLEIARSTIVSCVDMQWFVQAVTLYKANWHLKLHQLHARRREFEMAASHKQQMIDSLDFFEGPSDPLGFATKVEEMYAGVCGQMQCGVECPRSEFGRFACELYLKFGQFNRARRVMHLVGSEDLLKVIDEVQARST